MDKKLIVEIPKKFKKGLQKKWLIKNYKGIASHGNCALCDEYYPVVIWKECNSCCPFVNFYGKIGCVVWLKAITKMSFNSTKEFVRAVKREAPKYIKWV